uniref:Uncharacterized protein n=1 Tax=Molossus molossus TaxID=27622 RepID=A0A7J8FS70_MOLMO|nr:hypothetical protein HJG59_008415 [Molossus molossus]
MEPRGSLSGTHVDRATPPTRFAHAPPPHSHAGHVCRLLPSAPRSLPGTHQLRTHRPRAHKNLQCLTRAAPVRSSSTHHNRPVPTQGPHWSNVTKGAELNGALGEGKIDQGSQLGHVSRAGNLTAHPAGDLDLQGVWELKRPCR